MSQVDSNTTYLRYKTYDDLLKVILYSSQSILGAIPLLYHINYNNQEIVFIQTGGVGSNTVHYIIVKEKPSKKFIELKRLTGEFIFVDKIGSDGMSLYVPVLELEKSTLKFS
ncbi:MAG: hypothetical protein HY223_05730 [Thaumarchaeota archaeon]|nr:hypothetical protein [Nitrososphaerota archaeon]